MKIKKAIVLSDTHCGGSTALWPDKFESDNGQTILPSKLQYWILGKWNQFQADALKLVNGEPFVLIINGDVIEGFHHRSKQVIGKDENDHCRAFLMLIKPLAAKAAKVYMTEGTECHTRDYEHGIASELKAVPDSIRHQPCHDRIDIELNGIRCIFHHHMPTTSREHLRTNAIGMMLANEQLSAGRAGEKLPQVLGMAHRHLADAVSGSYGVAFSTPSWQIGTRFVSKVAPHASQSRIEVGGSVLDFSMGHPFHHHLLYRPCE